MSLAPFRVSLPPPATVEVSLEPVYNALTSLSVLHIAAQFADLDPWVTATAAALTPTQLEHNRLVFEGLGEALIPAQPQPDFGAYLDDLAALRPVDLRNRMLDRICRPERVAAPPTTISGTLAVELLADGQVFSAHMARLYPNDPQDPALLASVHALLNDPPALHDLIVGHLRTLWETALADEWRRRQPKLQALAQTLQGRRWAATTAAETIRGFIGREPPPSIGAQLEGVQRIVFVLSPHLGPYASRFGAATTIWVFVRARPEDLPLRQAPVKRAELISPLSALADDTRLQILELLAQHDELLAQEIITALDLSQSSISRHLKQLRSAGFLQERRGDGANKSYRLSLGRVEWTFRSLLELLSSPTPQPADTRSAQPLELRRFLDETGRVVSWPARRKDQKLVLAYLAEQFEPGREYSEKEINLVLRQWDSGSDPATLRRDMYDEHLLDRTSDGARYWRPVDPPAER